MPSHFYTLGGLRFCTFLLALGLSACVPSVTPVAGPIPSVTLTGNLTFAVSPPASVPPSPSANPSAQPTDQPPKSSTASPAPVCTDTHGQVSPTEFDSRTFKRRVQYIRYLPPCYSTSRAQPYPVLYLLHGASADDTQWLDLQVAVDADRLILEQSIAPMVIVLPDGDYRSKEDYASFVQNDLMPQIEQTTHVARTRAGRAIGGLSRGGYWALRLALSHPELFSTVGGHSPATDSQLLPSAAGVTSMNGLRIYLDVGHDDALATGVNAFVALLQAHGMAPEFHLNPGGHNRPYWRSHTEEYLKFYAAFW